MLLVPENGLWPSLITMKTYNQQLLLCQALAPRKGEKSNCGDGKAEGTGGGGMVEGEGKLRAGVWGRRRWEWELVKGRR